MTSFKNWLRKRPIFATNLILIIALATATIACTSLFIARLAYTKQSWYGFMVWNLMLAWIPLLLAVLAQTSQIRQRPYVLFAIFLGWMLCLPNAPYMMTDLIHLLHLPYSDSSILWFDLIMLLMFALTGLLLTFASLRLMQFVVAERTSQLVSWLISFLVLTLCSYGIVVGRVLRLNSWDVVTQPVQVFISVGNTIINPIDHLQLWAMVISFTLVLLSGYIVVTAFSRLSSPTAVTYTITTRTKSTNPSPFAQPQQL